MRVRHTLLAALAVAALTVPLAAAAAPTPVPGQGHVQNLGWLPTSTTIIGTTGKALRLEAVKLSGFPVEYQAHVQNVGWLPWVDAGEQAGTTGKSLRMEAIRIRLVPTAAMFGSVEYRCHVQDLWLARMDSRRWHMRHHGEVPAHGGAASPLRRRHRAHARAHRHA
jgi:uncharacterized protein YjdB